LFSKDVGVEISSWSVGFSVVCQICLVFPLQPLVHQKLENKGLGFVRRVREFFFQLRPKTFPAGIGLRQ